MSYKVFVEVGKGKNRSTSGSVSLSNKQKVSNWIKKSPFVRSNTNVKVTNLKTGKTITATRGRFYKNPITKKYRY